MAIDAVLITGASSDIGLELIRRMAATGEGPAILAHGHSSVARIEALREALGTDRIHPLQADFGSVSEVKALAERITREFGVPRQVVHAPGLKLVYERFSKFNWEHFEADFHVQVRSAVLLLQKFLPVMAKMPRAQVVFLLSSVTRGMPPKFMSMYTLVKQAELGLMRALAAEYAESGVTVNGVCPGMVETRFLDRIPPIVKEMAAAASPQKRNATPADVVDAIEFLLSPRAGYISGIELPVTGGLVV
jgi:3-oxoacyl-[acyl-carrier protein] reductase